MTNGIDNTEALNRLHFASITLEKGIANPDLEKDRDKFLRALRAIAHEFDVLLHLDPKDPYRALTVQFKTSKKLIKDIIKDQNDLKDAIALAAQIASALSSVMPLFV